jgi:hypothetical protein
MAQVIKTTFQLRRGKAASWSKNNPILALAEPGYETDTGKIKYGDGITPWNELKYFGANEAMIASGVYAVSNYSELPVVGDSKLIYKVEDERKIYQWNAMESKYESLSGGSFDPSEIKLINGGNANGTD